MATRSKDATNGAPGLTTRRLVFISCAGPEMAPSRMQIKAQMARDPGLMGDVVHEISKMWPVVECPQALP